MIGLWNSLLFDKILVHWLHHGFGMANGIFGDPSMELGMVVFPSCSLWSLASILGKLSTQFECHEMRMIRFFFVCIEYLWARYWDTERRFKQRREFVCQKTDYCASQ